MISCFVFSPLAIIFGIIGRKKSKSPMALVGIILGAAALALIIFYIIASVLWYSPTDTLESFFDNGLYF